MRAIKKDKFLSELGKLLTFMRESDRKFALAEYENMFLSSENEDTLLSYLVSPTRQAVLMARAYDSASDADSEAEFIRLIHNITDNAPDKKMTVHMVKPFAELEDSKDCEPQLVAETGTEEPKLENIKDQISKLASDIKEIEENDDKGVQEFLEELKIEDDISSAKANETTGEKVLDEKPLLKELPAGEEIQRIPLIPRLILFIILAVPATAIGIILLLIPALLSLGVAAICAYVGALSMSVSFGGFTYFSDVMVVLGVALILFALAVLFLWLFAWFIGGAIVKLVNSVIGLAGKMCYKETPAI